MSPQEKLDLVRAAQRGLGQGDGAGAVAPTSAMRWFKTMWPQHFEEESADHQIAFAESAFKVKLEDSPDPEANVWPRGGGKTTWCEAATAMVGCRGTRKYVLYVRRTQARADDAVTNIAALLEAPSIEKYYPQHAHRYVGKFGRPGAWRRNRVRTAGGFTVDAIGLDTAARGVKVEHQRPDLIIFDDFDEKLDGPHITAKLLEIIKHSIIPAGAKNVWIIMVQNLITKAGVMSQVVDGTADFLHNRKLSGPIPAIRNLKWEWRADENGIRRALIVGGMASWKGQSIETCQKLIDKIGISAFLKECQHAVKTRVEGIILHYGVEHKVRLTTEKKREIVEMGRVFAGIDFGIWRFFFVLFAVDRHGVVYRIDEYFAQRIDGQKSFSERSRAIHELCTRYGLDNKMVPIWGDAANPTDIHELNLAFRRGWDDTEEDRAGRKTVRHLVSKLRVVPVKQAHKSRKTGVERLNDLLDRNQLRYCELEAYEWRLGMTSDNPEGVIMTGSRLEWEMENWSFELPKPGEPQGQDPDKHTDASADGADGCAAQRYAIMSAQAMIPATTPLEFGQTSDDQAEHFSYEKGQFVETPHASDFLRDSGGRRTPAMRAPRPRMGR